MPVSDRADRAAEFNRLLVTQGHATRSMKYGHKPGEEELREIVARTARLVELAELLGYEGPEAYVNERLAAWLKMNPLPLAMEHLQAIFEEPLYSTDNGIYVQIGELAKNGYQYRVMRDDFAWTGAREEPAEDGTVVRGEMVLRIPDSVAEIFRQQGRRQLQREFASMMALETRY